jgi:threonine synthase
MKLIRAGGIPKDARVVVLSTAHGLKFTDFKLRAQRGEMPGADRSLVNLPVEVPADLSAVMAAIQARLAA